MNVILKKLVAARKFLFGGFIVLSAFLLCPRAEAQLFNSSSYQMLQPIVNTSQVGSSTSFQITSTITQVSILPTNSAGPTITKVHAPVVGYTSAEVAWITDIVASSTVNWGTSTAYGSASSSNAMTIEHALKLTGLSESTLYYYKVTSYDALGNASTSDNGGAGYTFTTPLSTITVDTGGGTRNVYYGDSSTPLIGTVDVTDITSTTATVSFKTTKFTNDTIKYGIGYSGGGLSVGSDDVYQKSHKIILTNLASSTEYAFKVKVLDIYGFSNESSELRFTTAKSGGPSAAVSFEPSGAVEKLSDSDKSTIEKFSKVIKVAPLTFVNNALKAFLSAIADNPVSKEINEESFTAAVSEAAAKIISSPNISGTDIAVHADAHSATIIWTTDKKADSLVAFAKASEYDPKAVNPYSITVGFPDESTSNHKVVLENLEPNTPYHFQIRSQGRLGPIALSSDLMFTTLSLTPEITSVKFNTITDSSATVQWETNLPTKNTITITNGRTGEVQTQEDKSFLKVHTIDLKDFTPSTSYTLRLKAVDEAGHTSFPSVVPFTTAISTTPPKVSQVRIVASLIPDQLDTVQTIVSWKTDKPSTSQVFYGEGISNNLNQSTPLDNVYTRDHIVITTSLKAGQVYQVQVRSTDPQNHVSQSAYYTTLTPRPKQSAIDLIFKNLDSTFGFLKF